jgi:hypothetical protein
MTFAIFTMQNANYYLQNANFYLMSAKFPEKPEIRKRIFLKRGTNDIKGSEIAQTVFVSRFLAISRL